MIDMFGDSRHLAVNTLGHAAGVLIFGMALPVVRRAARFESALVAKAVDFTFRSMTLGRDSLLRRTNGEIRVLASRTSQDAWCSVTVRKHIFRLRVGLTAQLWALSYRVTALARGTGVVADRQ